jgi:hypothetical protein
MKPRDVLADVLAGLADVAAGRTVPHTEARERLKYRYAAPNGAALEDNETSGAKEDEEER